MSGWASLSGYLFLKPGGRGLNILKTRKKLWCVLEESQGKLLYFKSQDEAKNKPPVGFVELKGAAITLDMDTQNQFVIIVEGREILLTAENHESMMIWMMALQARRDQFALADKVCTDNADGLDPFMADGVVSSRERSASDLSALKDYQPRQNQHETPKRPSHRALEASRSLHLQSPSGSPNYKTLPPDWKRSHLQRMGATIDGGHPSLKTVYEKDRSRSLPPLLEDIPLSVLQAGSKQQSVSMEMTDVLHLVECQQNGHNNNNSNNNNNNNNNLILSPKSPMVNGSFLMWSSSSPSTDNNDDHCLDLTKHRVLARSASARMGDDHKRHMTSHHVSDSSLNIKDPQSGDRVSTLEQELIATKCELAKAMNRQTCFQEILKQKDDIIEDLDVKLCSKAQGTDGYDSKKRPSPSTRDSQERVRILQNQNRFLNEEVRRLAKLRFHEHGVIRGQNSNISSLEANIEVWKLEYVSLIQSSIRFTGTDTMDDAELSLFGGDRHKDRIVSLLQDARKLNPSLPTYEYLATGEVHVDSFGFKHQFSDEGLLLHYLCQELSHHYLSQANSYEKHQKHWSLYLQNNAKNVMADRKELKDLVRGGIPEPYRKLMWKAFVLHQVDEIIKDKGAHYYRSLCNAVPDSPLAARYRKQISLDLMRTMPSNVKFSTPGSKGIMDLQDVLLAFCLHNPTVGYCQGMNFLVAMALLFLDAQDAFWTLVAVTEKYHSPSYFDHNLLGAQADQSVLHDLMREKLPGLTRHLDSIDIEISTVTLNWFLALFFDAVPFQTLLRVWDCFLLEGPKVLFRFSLAILQLHSKEIIKKTDTISVMRHLKACARISYDSDGLVQVAFKTLKPFPRRQDIFSKQTFYLNALKEKYRQREMQRVAFLEMEGGDTDELGSSPDAFECGTVSSPGEAWVAYGDDTSGSKVCVVNCKQQTMTDTDIRLDTRILAMTCVPDDCILLGTLSCFVYACCQDTREIRWQQRVHDAVLALILYQEEEDGHRHEEEEATNRLFAGLADGTVAVFETVTLSCKVYDIIYITVGQSPVTCLQVIGNQLWCACGNSVSIIHASTLDPMDRFCVSINPYDTVLSLVPGLPGVWISVRGSSVLELWDPLTLTCKLLYDVKLGKSPSVRKDDDTCINSSRITSVLALDHSVWIGTGEGTLMTFDVFTRSKTDTESPSFMTDGMVSADSQGQSRAASSTDRAYKGALTADQENYAMLKEVERRVKDLYLQRLVGDGYLRKKSTKDANASMDEEDDTETEETKCLILEREERETRKRKRKLGTRNGVGDGEVNSAEQRMPHNDRKRNSAGERTLMDKVREGIDAKIHPEAKYIKTTTATKDSKEPRSLPRPKSFSKADKLLNIVAGKSGLTNNKTGNVNESASAVLDSYDVIEDIEASLAQTHQSSRNTSTSSYHALDKTLCEVDVSGGSGAEEREQERTPEPTNRHAATFPSPSSPPPPSHPTVYYLFQQDSKDAKSKAGSSATTSKANGVDDRIDNSEGAKREIKLPSVSPRSTKKSVDSGVSSIAEKSADNSDLYCDNNVSSKTNRVDGNAEPPRSERQRGRSEHSTSPQRENPEQSNPNEERQPTTSHSITRTKHSIASESSLECAVNVTSRFYDGGDKRRDVDSEKGGADSGHKTSQTASSFDSKSRSLSLDSNKSNDYDEVFSDTVACPDAVAKSARDAVEGDTTDHVESQQDAAVKIAEDNPRPVNSEDSSVSNGQISGRPSTSRKNEEEGESEGEMEREKDEREVNGNNGGDNKKERVSKNPKSKTPVCKPSHDLTKMKKESDSDIIPTQNGDVTCYPVTDKLPCHKPAKCNVNGNDDYSIKSETIGDGSKGSRSLETDEDNKIENIELSRPVFEKCIDAAEEIPIEKRDGSRSIHANAPSPRVPNGKLSSSSSSEEESFGDFVGKTIDKADDASNHLNNAKDDTGMEDDTVPGADTGSSSDLHIEEDDDDDESDNAGVSSDDVSSIEDSPSTGKPSLDEGRRGSLPSVKNLREKFESRSLARPQLTAPVAKDSWRKTKEDRVNPPTHTTRASAAAEPRQTDAGQIRYPQKKLCRLSSSGHSDYLAHETCSSVSSAMEKLPESPKEVTSPKDAAAPSTILKGMTRRSDGRRRLEKQVSYDEDKARDMVDTKFYGDSDEDLSVHEARVKSFKENYAAVSQRRISLTTSGKFQNKGDASSDVDHNSRSQMHSTHRTLRQYDDHLSTAATKPSDEGLQNEVANQKDEHSSSGGSFSNLSSLSRKTSPARQNSEQSSVCDNILPRDADAQYRLDYTNLHVETDLDSVATSVEDQSMTDSFPSSRRLSGLSSTTEMRNQRMHEFLRDTATSLNAQFGDIEDDAAASFLPTPTLSGCNSACWSSYDEISTPSHCGAEGVRSSRPDSKFPRSSTQSVASRGTSVASTIDIFYNADLSLLSKNKVSDKPVVWLLNTELGGNPVVISLAGAHSDDEAVLIWTRETNETLWTNCPAYEYNPKTKTSRMPSYMSMRQHLSSTSSSRSSPRQRIPSVNSN